jgi:FG-GAP-like repeat/Abnormal spindle-like microcephaly-assoc'd, ASPM-SPD-2-Hydin
MTSLRSGSSCIYLLIILSILSFALVPYGESQVTFFNPPTYSGGGAIFVADFNRDGKLDILAADGTLNLGNGNGTFTTGTPVGSATAVADFNGDGIPDVLAGDLLVLLGNGNGTFQPGINTPPNANLSSEVAGDVNGDGKADVLGLYNNNLVVYLSNGDGTFAAGVSYPAGSSSSASQAITLGDFNGDGIVDVAVSLAGDGENAGEEVVFLGNGDGTFQAGKTSTGGRLPTSVVAGDFNGDGKLDLVIAGPICNGSCAPIPTVILLGNGDGTFQAPTTIFSNSGTVVSGDVNGDGKLDLVLLGSVVQIYLGNGDGTFSNTHSYLPAPPNYGGTGLALADFNGDGNLDVAALNNVLLGNGNGTFRGWAAAALPSTDIPAAVAGIFVKNGKPGVAALSNSYSDTTLYILTNDGTGALTLAHTYDLHQLGSAIATADVNGDGNLDLVVQSADFTTQNWSYTVLLGNGDGSFQPPVVYPQSNATGGFESGVLIADFNKDGKPDLAFPAVNETVAVLLGNGNGTFGAPVYYYVGGGAGPIVTADFNDDGKLDIASGSLALLLGNGNGTFQPATFPFVNGSAGSLLTGILTGSGNADLVSGTFVDLGNGNGTFTNLTSAIPSGMYVTGLADINGDGKPDAIGFSSVPDHMQNLGLALGNGDGTFGSYITVVQDQPAVAFLAVADMNGDGKQDLVGEDGGSIIFVLLNTTVPVAGASFSPLSLTFPSQTVGASSAATAVTLTNSGAVVLTVTGVTLGGADAGEFSQTNNCTTVQPLATCTINVTFTPTAPGTATANLIVSDNAGSGSQVVVVSGTGASTSDFTLGMPSGGSSSSTIAAGGSATFSLLLTPTGSFSGVVSLTCAITPAASSAPICTVPGSVSVGSSPTPVTVTVTTTAAGSAVSGPFGDWPASRGFVGWMLALGAWGILLVGKRRRAVCAATIVVALLVMVGCGGGSSTSPTPATNGTPSGTYTATVTATSGSLSHQAALTVIVQ